MTTPEYDLWAEEHKPEPTLVGREYHIKVPKAPRTWISVTVDEHGMLNITHGLWFNRSVKYVRSPDGDHFHTLATWALQKEVFEWMQEWELAILQPIGPEDSEWFATEKLDPEWGLKI